MKRMYITLAIILIILIGALTAIGQTTQPFDRAKRRMELREEMHRRMRAKLFQGQGPDQNMFADMEAEMESLMADSFEDMNSLSQVVSNFQSEWTETKEGRVLTLTPQSPEQKLNIDVNATVITIKGESVQKTTTSSVSSSFSNSFPVPADCDGSKVKMSQKNGRIEMLLPFKVAVKEVRKPLPPTPGTVEI